MKSEKSYPSATHHGPSFQIWISWRETHHPSLQDWTSKSPKKKSWKVADLQPFCWGVFSNHHGLKSLGPAWICPWHLSKSIKYTPLQGHFVAAFIEKRWLLMISRVRDWTGVVAREPEFELIQRFFLSYLQPFGGRYIYISICIYVYIYIHIWIYESTLPKRVHGGFSGCFFLRGHCLRHRRISSCCHLGGRQHPWGNSFQIPDLLGLTPWKINMEPENDGLEDDFPF